MKTIACSFQYEMSTMLAVNPVGFAVGTLATGYLADKFGRRATILGSAIPIALGSVSFFSNIYFLKRGSQFMTYVFMCL